MHPRETNNHDVGDKTPHALNDQVLHFLLFPRLNLFVYNIVFLFSRTLRGFATLTPNEKQHTQNNTRDVTPYVDRFDAKRNVPSTQTGKGEEEGALRRLLMMRPKF